MTRNDWYVLTCIINSKTQVYDTHIDWKILHTAQVYKRRHNHFNMKSNLVQFYIYANILGYPICCTVYSDETNVNLPQKVNAPFCDHLKVT